MAFSRVIGKGLRCFKGFFYRVISPLQKHVRKVVGGFGKKSCVAQSGLTVQVG